MISTKIQKRILDLIETHGIKNVTQLAALAGLRQSTISSILEGKSQNPQIETIQKICIGIGISLREFFNTPDFDELDESDLEE